MTTTTPPLLLTYKQTAAHLGVSERTVWQMVKDGRLKAVRFSEPKIRRQRQRDGTIKEILHAGSVRIDRRDIDEFIERAKGGQEVYHAD